MDSTLSAEQKLEKKEQLIAQSLNVPQAIEVKTLNRIDEIDEKGGEIYHYYPHVEVDFSADVTGCAYVATLGQTGSNGTAVPGLITVVGRSGMPNGVFVETGDRHGHEKNRSFQIDVGC